tara:strand:+ start:233 stop:1045 length:813 start_codon:yes stop_codon:yes gene_type:complete
MIIFKSINKLNKEVNFKANIGFVPTMGALHDGHISLIKSSKKKCKKTLVSIFVNPTQFNNKKDLSKYPRTYNSDIKILKNLNVDYVLKPSVKDIYKNKKLRTINIKKKDKILCAYYRPGHFEGVLAVINGFLKNIKAKNIFFGEKDYQQLFLIKKFIKNKFKINVISCPTVRDKRYVALSSRNRLLGKKELKKSSFIAKKLYLFSKKYKYYKNKKLVFDKILKEIKNLKNIKVEYLELRNKKNLSLNYTNKNVKIFIAYYNNNIRLIDNF